MKKHVALLMTMTALTGCDFDLGLSGLDLGSGWGDGYGDGCCYYEPTLEVTGEVMVGSYFAVGEEAVVLVYSPLDTLTVIDSTSIGDGQYFLNFGSSPTSDVCTYLARVQLWNGEESDLLPLFLNPPAACDAGYHAGARFQMSAYEPLEEPFAVRGRIYVDGSPAGQGEAEANVYLRNPGRLYDPTRITTDAEGRYEYETTDRAVWFATCVWLRADAVIRGEWIATDLGPVSLDSCTDERVLPDMRYGSQKAAMGRVTDAMTGKVWEDRFGDVEVQIVHATDTTIVVDPVSILDDGSFHIWFPHDLTNPGCDWLLVARLNSVQVTRRPLFPSGNGCWPPEYHDLQISTAGPGPAPALLTMDVEDPTGDHTGATDVTRMSLTFDPSTGEYRIALETDTTAMLQDSVRINVNLYNPEAGTFFSHTMADFRFDTPASQITLTGTSIALRAWREGQSVYTNSLEGTPNPPGSSLYRSAVNHFPLGFLTNEDVIAFADLSTPAVIRSGG